MSRIDVIGQNGNEGIHYSLSPTNKEQLDIIRRIAERGRAYAWKYTGNPVFDSVVDAFQHILDELERIK